MQEIVIHHNVFLLQATVPSRGFFAEIGESCENGASVEKIRNVHEGRMSELLLEILPLKQRWNVGCPN